MMFNDTSEIDSQLDAETKAVLETQQNKILYAVIDKKYADEESLFSELGFLIGKYCIGDNLFTFSIRDMLMSLDFFGIGDDKVDAVYTFVDKCIAMAEDPKPVELPPHDSIAGVKARYQGKIRTHAQAKKDYEQCIYIVDDLIWERSIGIWFGPSGIKKTLLLQNMAACIAGGHEFLPTTGTDSSQNLPTFATNKSDILWIDYDNGERTTNTRHAAAAAGVCLTDDDHFYAMSEAEPWLALDNPKHIVALAELINEIGGIKLVFIDALGLVTGEVDENSPDMSTVMRNAKRLRGMTNAAIHVVHHPNKASKGQETDSRNAAGNAKITNFAEFVVEMSGSNDDDVITCVVTKNREYVSRKTFSGVFGYDHMKGTSDLESFQFFSTRTLTPAQEKEEAVRLAIGQFLADESLNKTKLRDLVKYKAEAENGGTFGVNYVSGIIGKMEYEGLLKIVGRKGESMMVSLVKNA